MATVIQELRKRTTRRLLTVADLAVFPDELPSGPVKYELDDGKLVMMAPPGGPLKMGIRHRATTVRERFFRELRTTHTAP